LEYFRFWPIAPFKHQKNEYLEVSLESAKNSLQNQLIIYQNPEMRWKYVLTGTLNSKSYINIKLYLCFILI